jgi:GNAT superfamily N-acetyltransferase
MQIIDVTDEQGSVTAPHWLARAYPVHVQLRPSLVEKDYRAKMERVFAGGGRMCLAVSADKVSGVAVYRMYENTFDGRLLYVDDLVTDEACRSQGVGRAVMAHLDGIARRHGRAVLSLDSGVQRAGAHKFYFREAMAITSFHFRRSLS